MEVYMHASTWRSEREGHTAIEIQNQAKSKAQRLATTASWPIDANHFNVGAIVALLPFGH